MKQLTRASLLILAMTAYPVQALSCAETTVFGSPELYCKQMLGPTSTCLKDSKVCSNPYASGCLRSKLGDAYNKRVCNSDDDPEASTRGDCLESRFNYTEIRVHNSNWESSMFLAWIYQILLSERLQVPVTVGLGPNTIAGSFYNIENTLEYSPVAYPFDALKVADEVGDCRLETNRSCVHVLPEVWNGQEKIWTQYVSEGWVQPVEGCGEIGKISIYVPAALAKHDPSLTIWYGLQGPDNQPKLAEYFKRPTTWKDYCDQISLSNCSKPDETASRYPSTTEEDVYFSEGDFAGYFRATDRNNCTLAPSCTGHIVGPPCTWSTNLDSQLYWNDIALESNGPLKPSGGYGYSAMIEIWKAANATQSPVMMWWWEPDATVELFRGSSYAFQRVLFPEATATCKANQIDGNETCNPDVWVRRGNKLGSCDSDAHSLRKIIASGLYKLTRAVANPADQSPGYDTISNIKVSQLDMNVILKKWIERGVDTYGFDAHEVVCSYVAEHIDELDYFIPEGFPRVLSDQSLYNRPYLYVAQALASVIAVVCLGVTALVYKYRNTKVFVFAQVYFIFLLQFGFVLVPVAAIVYVLEPSVGVCVSREWLATLGYTFQLAPLLVKISTINSVLQSSKKMKRVRISPEVLTAKVGGIVTLVTIYLILWTVLATPGKLEERVLVSEYGTLIETSIRCSSDVQFWVILSLAWEGLLLVCSTVLAFQSRNVIQEFNEAQSLATMTYSHFVFMVLRAINYVLEKNNTFQPNLVATVNSYLLSLDTLFALLIYVGPKLMQAKAAPEPYSRGAINMNTSELLTNIRSAAARASLAGASTRFMSAANTAIPERSSPAQSSQGTQSSMKRSSSHSIEAPSVKTNHQVHVSPYYDDDDDDDDGCDRGGPRWSKPELNKTNVTKVSSETEAKQTFWSIRNQVSKDNTRPLVSVDMTGSLANSQRSGYVADEEFERDEASVFFTTLNDSLGGSDLTTGRQRLEVQFQQTSLIESMKIESIDEAAEEDLGDETTADPSWSSKDSGRHDAV